MHVNHLHHVCQTSEQMKLEPIHFLPERHLPCSTVSFAKILENTTNHLKKFFLREQYCGLYNKKLLEMFSRTRAEHLSSQVIAKFALLLLVNILREVLSHFGLKPSHQKRRHQAPESLLTHKRSNVCLLRGWCCQPTAPCAA